MLLGGVGTSVAHGGRGQIEGLLRVKRAMLATLDVGGGCRSGGQCGLRHCWWIAEMLSRAECCEGGAEERQDVGAEAWWNDKNGMMRKGGECTCRVRMFERMGGAGNAKKSMEGALGKGRIRGSGGAHEAVGRLVWSRELAVVLLSPQPPLRLSKPQVVSHRPPSPIARPHLLVLVD